MHEFIQMVTGKLGTSESTARSATGGLLRLIQNQIGNQDFDRLAEKIPGTTDLLREGAAAPAAGGGFGGFGNLMETATSAVGGKLGATLGLAAQLKGSGLDMSKAGSFVSLFMEFVKSKAGADLAGRILGKIPELKGMAG